MEIAQEMEEAETVMAAMKHPPQDSIHFYEFASVVENLTIPRTVVSSMPFVVSEKVPGVNLSKERKARSL